MKTRNTLISKIQKLLKMQMMGLLLGANISLAVEICPQAEATALSDAYAAIACSYMVQRQSSSRSRACLMADNAYYYNPHAARGCALTPKEEEQGEC